MSRTHTSRLSLTALQTSSPLIPTGSAPTAEPLAGVESRGENLEQNSWRSVTISFFLPSYPTFFGGGERVRNNLAQLHLKIIGTNCDDGTEPVRISVRVCVCVCVFELEWLNEIIQTRARTHTPLAPTRSIRLLGMSRLISCHSPRRDGQKEKNRGRESRSPWRRKWMIIIIIVKW